MTALAQRVVETYPWSVLGKDASTGQWRFICAVGDQVMAESIGTAVFESQGIETKVERT